MRIVRRALSEISSTDLEVIDNLISRNQGLIFHEAGFNRIVADYFGSNLEYFFLIKNDLRTAGICPAHIIKQGLVARIYSNPTHCEMPYGGWVLDQDYSPRDLIAKMPLKINEILIYWSSFFNINISLGSGLAITEHQTAIIDLDRGEETIWQDVIDPRKKNKVRKAWKNGISFREGEEKDLPDFCSLLQKTRTAANLRLRELEFYLAVFRLLQPQGKVRLFLAELGKELVAAVLIIGNANCMHYWQGTVNKEAPNLGQSELLQWEAIKWSQRRGARFYDMCVVDKEHLPHIASFKCGFAREVTPFYSLERKPFLYRFLNRINRMQGNYGH